jgi:hypothetical protein
MIKVPGPMGEGFGVRAQGQARRSFLKVTVLGLSRTQVNY